MANLVLPTPNVPLGKCPHCSAEVLVTPAWHEQLLKLLKQINQGSAITAQNTEDIEEIKLFVGMP